MSRSNEETIAFLKSEIKKYQSEGRYLHTLGVYSTCEKLAEIFGLDENEKSDLCRAALLHDITKDLSGAKQIELCEKYSLPAPRKATEPMPTVHQDTGAFFAREIFGEEIVTDAVFSAIASHTTGSESMSNTDRLLFVADYIEPTRKYKSCIEMREYLFSECGKINKNDKAALYRLLTKTVVEIIGNTVMFLSEKKRRIDYRMILAWNALV